MDATTDPGPLIGRTYALDHGPRVRLALARPRDRAGIAALSERLGATPTELELARLVSFDPRRQLVLCATALVSATETIVGVGAIDIQDGGPLEPRMVLADHARAGGLESLLSEALVGHARAILRARAA